MYRHSRVALVGLLWVVSSVASQKCGPSAPLTDPQKFLANTFDYLIIGGGTAGLALASRLAENDKVNVGVIEAGVHHQNDPLIDIPANIGLAAGNPAYDWNFVTVPQAGAGGRSIAATRGKLLGGSSGLNFLAWNRASKAEYDSWKSFASGGSWNWEGILPYLKKATAVFPNQTNPFLVDGNSSAAFDPRDVGFQGPVQSSFNVVYPDPVPFYVKALNALGITTNANPDNGTTTGLINTRSNVDRVTGTRSYAASTYYCRSLSRKNFHVLMNAQATKVMLEPAEDARHSNKLKSVGVQFSFNSRTYFAKACGEVILSAGVYQSPHLLELSGIGNKTLLARFGIHSAVDLPSVGENLQDHLAAGVQFQLKDGFLTFDELKNNATFAAEQASLYNETRSGILAATNSALSFLPPHLFLNPPEIKSLLNAFDGAIARRKASPLQAKQFATQRGWIQQGSIPQLELILFSNGISAPVPNQSFITVLATGMHHVSRGSVHINSSAPLAAPAINPSWLDNDFDVLLMLKGLKFAHKVGTTAPLSDIIRKVAAPFPDIHDDVALTTYIRQTIASSQHPMGTAAMGPRELGGVVDGDLKVYGTTNLRVCDASVIPVSIATHLQSTVYAIAEKLADILKAEQRR